MTARVRRWLASGRRQTDRLTEPAREVRARSGQTIVEFAIASVVFLLIVFGTVDFGRAIYLSAQLHNAVRDAARQGKVGVANGFGINDAALQRRVLYNLNPEDNSESVRPGLQDATTTVSCTGSCTTGDQLTVAATLPFAAVTQDFLRLSPISLGASATVTVE